MDVNTTISSPCGGLNETRNIVQYSGNDETNAKVAAFFGRKSDALSAVKLDPAVLEAQVTVETPKMDDYSHKIRPVEPKEPRRRPPFDFEAMVKKQEAALLSLTPGQMDLLMRFTDTLRRQRQAAQKQLECSFCKNNGKAVSWYSSHCLKDSRGCVKCPVLRSLRCHLCGATGDRAHTIKYCPDNVLLDANYWSR